MSVQCLDLFVWSEICWSKWLRNPYPKKWFSGLTTNPSSFTLEQSFTQAVTFPMCVIMEFRFVLLDLLHVCFIHAIFAFLWKVPLIHAEFSIRFDQSGVISRADIFLRMHFLKLGFTPCKDGQPLQDMELQEKEEE